MAEKLHGRLGLPAMALLAASALLLGGCTASSTSSANSDVQTGPAFVIGTDAPLAGVTSFSAQTSVALNTGTSYDSSTSVSITNATTPPTVDFARYNGLQGLVDTNNVPQGTYNSVTITLASPALNYLAVTSTATPPTTPPTIQSLTVELGSSSVTIQLDKPVTITSTTGAPVGVRMDLDLQKSIPTDSTGAIVQNTDGSVTVTPTFNVNTITNTDARGHIDELVAAVVTAPTSTTEPSSFVVQGPHGEQFTIDTTSNTDWDGDASLSSLTTSSIVLVAGQLDAAAQTLDADEIVILSQDGFYAGGLETFATDSTSTTNGSFQFYVRGVLPTTTGVQLGDLAQVNLTGSEKFNIHWMRNPFAQFLFNASGLVAGQEIAVGGPASGATSATAVTVKRVTLRDRGYSGTVVAGSQDSGKGSFQMQVTGFSGVVIPQTITVYLGQNSDFRFGCGGFGDLTDGTTVRVVGLLLKDPTTGNTILLARHVDGFQFTDFASVSW